MRITYNLFTYLLIFTDNYIITYIISYKSNFHYFYKLSFPLSISIWHTLPSSTLISVNAFEFEFMWPHEVDKNQNIPENWSFLQNSAGNKIRK